MISRGASAGARIPHARKRVCGVYAYEDAVMVLDPGNAACYPGTGQRVYNVIRNPSDGAAQSDYDFFLGTDDTVENTPGRVSDPAFVGLPGGCDGYFASANVASHLSWIMRKAADNTPFLKGMHKNGSKFTIEMWVRLNGGRPSGFSPTPLFDSGTSDHGGNLSARGVIYGDAADTFFLTSEHCIVLPRNEEGYPQNSHRLIKVADAQVEHDRVVMLAVSLDTTGATPSFLYKNGDYDPVGGNATWDGTPLYDSPFDTENRATINGRWMVERPDNANIAAVRTQFYFLRIYDRNLTKAELDANWTALRGRWGI